MSWTTSSVAPVLAAAGVAIVLWTPPVASRRLAAVCDAPSGRRSAAPVFLVPVAVPLVVLLAAGASAGVASGIAVTVVLWIRRKRRAERRLDRQLDDMLLALSLMIAELSVGAPPVRACEAAVTELRRRVPDAAGSRSEIADGLEAMAFRAALGGSVIDAPGTADGASGHASWHRIGIAWQTADQRGLPMIDMLGAVRSDLQARRGFADRTRAGLSGPRATATVLAGLPLLGIALGQATGAQPIQVLLGGGLGGVLLVAGTALAAAGVAWSERITGKVLTR